MPNNMPAISIPELTYLLREFNWPADNQMTNGKLRYLGAYINRVSDNIFLNEHDRINRAPFIKLNVL